MVRRASVTTAGLPARVGDFGLPWLTESGDAALFLADSPDLLDDGTRGSQHFLHRFDTGQTVLVEATTDGAPMNRSPAGATFDADGGRVAFATVASNIVPGDDNGTYDVFLRQYIGDLATTRASTEPDLPTPPRDPGVWFEANRVGVPAVDVTFGGETARRRCSRVTWTATVGTVPSPSATATGGSPHPRLPTP